MPNDKRELKIFKMSRISSGIRHSGFLCHWVLRHSQVSDHEERMLPSIRAYLSGIHVRLILTFVCIVSGLSGFAFAQPLVIVSDAQARAVIVVADNAPASTKTAAGHLQTIIAQMSGGQLPIQAESAYDGSRPAILVGMSSVASRMDINVAQDPEAGDQYIVRSGDDWLALIGNDGGRLCGSAYAVYDLLQRLGCGWYGPDPVWHVIPESPDVTVSPLNVHERPDFAVRHIWMVDPHPPLRFAWRLGALWIPMHHNLDALVPPAEYKEAHPEWFGLGQPCLTEPAVRQVIVEKFRTELDAQEGGLSFSLAANDSDEFCECDRCRAAGNVSARQMQFANNIARQLHETHLGPFRLCFLAYWVTHAPPEPMVEAEPGVIVVIVNEGNHVRPLDEPVPPEHARLGRNNLRERRAMAGWMKTGALRGVYEWWIPGCSDGNWRSVPWYSGETALRNLRYWKAHGIRYLTYETAYENGNGFPIRWPLYYVGARGAWNTDLTSGRIMTAACEKLYGSAAAHMFEFYRIFELAMAVCNEPGGNWNLPNPEKVYSPNVGADATAHLQRAAQATDDPKALARIAEEQKMWDEAHRTLANLRF
jgi:hypothetical protein